MLSPQVAFQMTSMLEDVVDRGTAASARRLGVTFPAAARPARPTISSDAWFVGFSSSLVVGVWVGFDQPRTIAADGFGGRVALPIWADFMRRTARWRPAGEFDRPAGLQDEVLCRISYARPVDGCPIYTEYFKEGDEIPRPAVSRCTADRFDSESRGRCKAG